ncbi:hypothetical protein SLOPH_2681 [Spraguea lophii 42_110]|uniref:RING-type domain-containing protein n=1 Tax=Spraguea lophii (strain 42_110) TaxID=1358809 RepID=S7XGA2_SPRLO|nr:hypothetical protein SLOPH_2681 [Spraguea lophii 42_110]
MEQTNKKDISTEENNLNNIHGINIFENKDNGLSNIQDDDVLVLRNKPISMERKINIMSGPGGIPIIRDVIIIETEASIARILTILGILSIYGIIFQSLTMLWEKYHKKSCRVFFSLLIFTVPIMLCFLMKKYFMLLLLISFNGIIIFVFNLIRRGRNTKFLFDFFKILFILVYVGVILSQLLLIISFLFFQNTTDFTFKIFIFFLYLGLLAREYVEISTLLFKTLPNLTFKENNCSICSNIIIPNTSTTLTCNHIFHNSCIRGWLMVGKNHICPVCNEKVIIKNLKVMWWEKIELFFGIFINFLRSIIAFSGVLIIWFMIGIKHN